MAKPMETVVAASGEDCLCTRLDASDRAVVAQVYTALVLSSEGVASFMAESTAPLRAGRAWCRIVAAKELDTASLLANLQQVLSYRFGGDWRASLNTAQARPLRRATP